MRIMQETVLLLVARLYQEASRCSIYSLRAVKDGQPQLARLFQAMAESHSRQATRFLLQVRGSIGDTAANIRQAFDRELPALMATFEQLEPLFREQGLKPLALGCRHGLAIARMAQSLQRQLAGQAESRDYHVCNFCGFISADAPPETCPICTAPKHRFIPFTGS